MKNHLLKFTLTIIAVFSISFTYSQSSDLMSYQAVIRDGSNQLIANQNLGMQISILEASETGTSVYTETQTTTSNSNGLVSLQIGSGTTTDDFSTIDWSGNSYFIKIETDLSGGTSYTLTSTSQLLSVPFALSAKTAENVLTETEVDNFVSNNGYITNPIEGTYLNTNPAFTIKNGNLNNNFNDGAQIAFGIADLNDNNATTLRHFIHTRHSDLSETQGNAIDFYVANSLLLDNTVTNGSVHVMSLASGNVGVGVTDPTDKLEVAGKTKTTTLQITDNASNGKVLTSDANGNATWQDAVTAATPTTYSVGDYVNGGVVIYIEPNGLHGLVVSMEDVATDITWAPNQNVCGIDSDFDGMYAGETNSELITAFYGHAPSLTTYAAMACLRLRTGANGFAVTNSNTDAYGDWYLPSFIEAEYLIVNKTAINTTLAANSGEILSGNYWTCIERDDIPENAWIVNTDSNIFQSTGKTMPPTGRKARAVRRF